MQPAAAERFVLLTGVGESQVANGEPRFLLDGVHQLLPLGGFVGGIFGGDERENQLGRFGLERGILGRVGKQIAISVFVDRVHRDDRVETREEVAHRADEVLLLSFFLQRRRSISRPTSNRSNHCERRDDASTHKT